MHDDSFIMHLTSYFNIPFLAFTSLITNSPSIAAPSSNNNADLCAALTSNLHEEISGQSTISYAASIASYWYQQERLSPECIVSPKDTADVSKIIRTANDQGISSTTNSSIVSVRSDGHSSVIGAANNNDEVTIDLRGMNELTLNDQKSIISVGVGSIWRDVYAKLQPMNLTVLGARVAGLGVEDLLTEGQSAFPSGPFALLQ
jgi:hypothetical protein